MVEVSPIAGRRALSASAFAGRALPPAQPDPVTTSLINKNSMQLGIVSNQIQGMTAQMNSLAGAIQVISNGLSTSQSIERQKAQQEQQLEAKLAEQKLREGKESIIEKKIANAATRPAQKLAAKAQFTLLGLTQYLYRLLGGWLLINGVKLIQEMSDDNRKRIGELKDAVLRGFGSVAGIFSSITSGLELIGGNFNRVGTRLLQLSQSGLFTNPVGQLLNFIKNSAETGWNKITESGGSLLEQGKEFLENTLGNNNEPAPEPKIDPNKPPGEQENLSNNVGGPSLPLEKLMGGMVDDKSKETTKESSVSATPTSNNLDVNKLMNRSTDQSVAENKNKESEEFDPSVPAEYGETQLEPVDAADSSSIEGDDSKSPQAGKMTPGGTSIAEMGFNMDIDMKSIVDTEKYIGKTGTLPVSEMFTAIKKDDKVAEKVGPAPEPPVNIVPIPMEQPSAAPPAPQPVSSGAINNAPSYATSNSDNIYVLGAYSNFNVIPV